MKATLYARVSSDKQDIDLSISAQLKALREYMVLKNVQSDLANSALSAAGGRGAVIWN